MATINCNITIEVVDNLCDWWDEEERTWMLDEVLGDPEQLILHSNVIGDGISTEVHVHNGLITGIGLEAIEFSRKGWDGS